ncbi:MAG: hypothetical protein Q8Q08_09525 [Candidatus Omnitrophota bacterium]|nr:hypothetical protein [Candidatus Omnitrophota bacterium]MDZ4242266.1 hypothetical protein [Candidatus Omnitrophota bacterium]
MNWIIPVIVIVVVVLFLLKAKKGGCCGGGQAPGQAGHDHDGKGSCCGH